MLTKGGFFHQFLSKINHVILGRTALRNLVLEYGADLAYTEEIIDEKLLKTRRTVNGRSISAILNIPFDFRCLANG